MSQRQAAKVLGVDQKTISRDVRQDASKNEAKSLTGSAATKARRANDCLFARSRVAGDVAKNQRLLKSLAEQRRQLVDIVRTAPGGDEHDRRACRS